MKKHLALVVSLALAASACAEVKAEVTRGSYGAETFWTEFVHEDGCVRTSTYVVLTFDTTKKSSVPPSVLVSRYADDICTGEFLLSAYGILEDPWTTRRVEEVSVADTVRVEGTSNDIIYMMDVPVELTWTTFTDPQRWWSRSGYEGACVVNTSTYEQTSWTAMVSGVVDGLPVDAAPAGKTVYSSDWKDSAKHKGC